MTNEPLWCQMCGRTLPDSEDVVFCKCDFCGAVVLRSQQTRPLEDALRARNVELVGMVERLIEAGTIITEYRGEDWGGMTYVDQAVDTFKALAAEWKEGEG